MEEKQNRNDHLKRLKYGFPTLIFISSGKAFQIHNEVKHKLNKLYSN